MASRDFVPQEGMPIAHFLEQELDAFDHPNEIADEMDAGILNAALPDLLQDLHDQEETYLRNFGNNDPEEELWDAQNELYSATLGDTMPPPPSPADLDAEFRKQQEIYKLKRTARTLTTTQEIEYLKLKAAYDARQRKIAADQQADEEQSPGPDTGSDSDLFVSDATNQYTYLHADDSDEEDERALSHSKRKLAHHEDDSSTTSAPAPRKAAKRAPEPKKAPREAYVDDLMERAARKKSSKTKEKAKAKSREINRPDMTSTQNILGTATNVFRDTEANAGLGDQPTFGNTTRRADALKQLIASVPAENRKIAATDRRFLDEACKAFDGTGACKAGPDGNWLVKGMRTSLKHYQVLGTAFMRKREHETQQPRGGILADEMGLGKTLMMLANIVNGKQTIRDKGTPKCTLIVASPALCNQWAAEISKHTLSKKQDRLVEHAKKHGLDRVVQHRAGFRLSPDEATAKRCIEEADICLTTYYDICKSYPKAVVPAELTTAAQKDQWWKGFYEENKGVFHQVTFNRVVLDEAHAIKNHKGHTSLACRALEATHYWAITGTPIMNRLTEFYPYFKFLREPYTGSFKIFKENFSTPDDPDGTARLAVFLRKIMIRRTHLDKLFGARLLDLPQPKQTVVWLSFNDTERQIYEIVKMRFIQRINTISKQENGVNCYSHIWTMVLRLRQLCAHILLVQDSIVDLLKREDFEKLNALCQRQVNEDEGASILLHLRHVLSKSVNEELDTVEAGAGGVGTVIGATQTAPINAVEFHHSAGQSSAGGRYGRKYDISPYMKDLTQSGHLRSIQKRSPCCACRQSPPHNPQVTSCFHIVCLFCIRELQNAAARNHKDFASCPECGMNFTSVTPCQPQPGYDDESSSSATPSNAGGSNDNVHTSKSKKDGNNNNNNNNNINDWIGLKGEILPSTKTIACKAQILEWLQTDPTSKIIIYTQFIPVIRILSQVCHSEGWGYVTYQGSQTQEARKNALSRFDSDPTCQILLSSLRCGGLGLNLTMAQYVILIDPWWNSAVEQQAFCRVFRIGQRRETRMTRFVVENTIDAAMMEMKERKEMEIDTVMENPRLKEKLTVEELMRMFGEVRTDEGGRPFIFAEGEEGASEERQQQQPQQQQQRNEVLRNGGDEDDEDDEVEY